MAAVINLVIVLVMLFSGASAGLVTYGLCEKREELSKLGLWCLVGTILLVLIAEGPLRTHVYFQVGVAVVVSIATALFLHVFSRRL